MLRVAPKAKLRTSDPVHLDLVKKWFSVVLPKVKPLLYNNGGPIISVQIENEYGNFGCDHKYMEKLRDITKEFVGNDVVLFTNDNSNDKALSCGKTDGVYATVDFGTGADPEHAFAQQRKYDPHAPLVNTEFYPGWFDLWSQKHKTIQTNLFVQRLDKILSLNASVNIYVFHGGSNFGHTAGSKGGEKDFKVCPTSYDYDAPLSEAGDTTDKYFAVKKTIEKYLPPAGIDVPPSSLKAAYGRLNMSCFVIEIFNFVNVFGESMRDATPLTFEAFSQPNGFLLYEHELSHIPSDPALLQVNGLRDRAIVFVNQQFQGILSREWRCFQLPIQASKGDKLQILVENQGRLASGRESKEYKGLGSDVKLGPDVLKDWKTSSVPLHEDSVIKKLREKKCDSESVYTSPIPRFYKSIFTIAAEPQDTFLRLNGWRKGQVFLNGFNLGRYWPVAGPQETLYVPKYKLKGGGQENDLLILELESSPCTTSQSQCFVEFVDKHVVNATVPFT